MHVIEQAQSLNLSAHFHFSFFTELVLCFVVELITCAGAKFRSHFQSSYHLSGSLGILKFPSKKIN